MPMVELAYSTVASDDGLPERRRHDQEEDEDPDRTDAAPISGRISMRCRRLRSLTRSSRTTLWLARSRSRLEWTSLLSSARLYRVPPLASSATASMLDLSMKDGPVRVGWPPPIRFLLFDVEPQRVDGEVALQERLLVDRPLHVTALDRVDQCGVGVEGDDLRVAARVASPTAPRSARSARRARRRGRSSDPAAAWR